MTDAQDTALAAAAVQTKAALDVASVKMQMAARALEEAQAEFYNANDAFDAVKQYLQD